MLKTFLMGAAAYPALELLWRGRTHYTMAIAGGSAALLICKVRRLPISSVPKVLLCGVGITGIEYVCGWMWNRDHSIWDYSRIPWNVQGQICLPYTLMWCLLSAGAMQLLPG